MDLRCGKTGSLAVGMTGSRCFQLVSLWGDEQRERSHRWTAGRRTLPQPRSDLLLEFGSTCCMVTLDLTPSVA